MFCGVGNFTKPYDFILIPILFIGTTVNDTTLHTKKNTQHKLRISTTGHAKTKKILSLQMLKKFLKMAAGRNMHSGMHACT